MPGSSGRPIGPSVAIFDETGKPVADGDVGTIVLKGCPTMEGYEGDEEANKDAFFPDGWFNTGDLGYMIDGWIFISGHLRFLVLAVFVY